MSPGSGRKGRRLELCSTPVRVFEVYGVLDLPHEIRPVEEALLGTWAPNAAESLVAGWIDRGPWPAPAGTEHVFYSGWKYRLRRLKTRELTGLPTEGEGSFPDLLFPPNRAWLVSLLWDDSWRSIHHRLRR